VINVERWRRDLRHGFATGLLIDAILSSVTVRSALP
jgi:hypothetical protein